MIDDLNEDKSNDSKIGAINPSADLASLMDDLSAEQRELLTMMLEEQGIDLVNSIILAQARVPAEDGIHWQMPISFAQQRLWFLDQLEPQSSLYNLLTIVHLTGELEVPVLVRCIEEIIHRHEILRTTFHAKAGQPFQLIAPQIEFELPIIDLRNLPKSNQNSTVMRLAAQDAGEPFDLASGPLLRVKLLQLSAQENVIIVNVHHIIADGWSVNVLIFEMALLYEAFKSGKSSPLPALPIQYADFAVWQRSFLSGPVLVKQVNYWLDKLSGGQPVLSLPYDFPPEIQALAKNKNAGKSIHFELSPDLYRQLLDFSQREGVTLFMTLLACFQVLLYRYSGQDDFNVGIPMANRTRAEMESLIGFFVNTLVLRAKISPHASFREFLGIVKENSLEAFANQDLPFEVLVEKLDLDRNTGTSPLFQVVFALQNATRQNKKIPGLILDVLPIESEIAKFDLSLIMVEDDSKLNGSIEYRTNLFTDSTIELFLKHYRCLLKAVVNNPDEKISHLRIMEDDEFRQLAVVFNRTEGLFESGHCIHELFEEQVRIQPDSTALIFVDGSIDKLQKITYAQLDQRANILARYLRSIGVGPEILVGVLVHRSIEVIVAILGILKSGGAYLPLDPNYPADRLRFMIEDSQVEYLIANTGSLQILNRLVSTGLVRKMDVDHRYQPTQVNMVDDQQTFKGVSLICIDDDWSEIERLASEADQFSERDRMMLPEPPICPENLAYVIYTSGSTGRPKGTLLQHRGICNLVNWQKEMFTIGRESRILQFSPLSFDASVWEIFMALANGAVLCLTTQETLADGLRLLKFLRELEVTTITLPPSVLNALATLPGKRPDPVSIAALPALRTVIAAGEACTTEIVARWAPGRRFFNAYGPTETTVCATIARCDEADLGSPPIGRPITNMHCYVLDSNQQLLPVGLPGELYIGGVGVGRGYLNRPDLTIEKFMSNPIQAYLNASAQPELAGETIYRTGDLVRYRSDGNLEFLGRIDEQVKLRGFRIELGEIEAVLKKFGGEQNQVSRPIRDAVVVIHQNEIGHKRLVAYLVGDVANLDDLRGYLHNSLPEYMIPSLILYLDQLPLNPSGKVDRKKLGQIQLPDLPRANSEVWSGEVDHSVEESFVLPRSPEEEIFADLFKRILHVEHVSIYDNFFELGGHSLLATQLIALAREVFQVDIPLRDVFESPTPARLAEIARNEISNPFSEPHRGVQKPAVIPRLPRDQDTGIPLFPPPLSFAQQRLWFLEQFEPGTSAYNIPTILRLKGILDVKALELSLNEIVRRHEVLRTAFITHQGLAFQVVQPVLPIQITIDDLRGRYRPTPDSAQRTSDSPVELDPAADQAWALDLAFAEVNRPFDISIAPLFRVKLIQIADDESYLVFSMHHLISDGWSIGILIRELSVLYPAKQNLEPIGNEKSNRAIEEPLLPALSIQYADFSVWQRDWLRDTNLEEQLLYWKSQLGDSLPVLNLPSDWPRPAIASLRGGHVKFKMAEELAQRLDEVSREAGTTIFMTLLGSFQVLLMRLSGQEEVSVGTPIAGRSHRDIENLIGFFVNTLVMKTRFHGDPNFGEVLSLVREVALGAYAHQDLPFETLVNEMNPVRELDHSPLFQVMFVMQNLPVNTLELPGLAISILDTNPDISRFDLTVTLTGDSKGFSGAVEYRQDLFTQTTIEGFISLWIDLINYLVDNLETPIKQISLAGLEDWVFHDQIVGRALPKLEDKPKAHSPVSTVTSPRTAEEAQLVEIWSKVLGKKAIGIFDNFFELGGDSILSMQVTGLAGEVGLQISPRHIFECQTIAELAVVAARTSRTFAEQGLVSGNVPLTPIQHWFFDLGLSNRSHFNQSMLFEVNQVLDLELLNQTIKILLDHHDALRMRFDQDKSGWMQYNRDRIDLAPIENIDISNLNFEDRKKIIEGVANQIQKSLDIEAGGLLRVVYFTAGENNPGRLLIVVHHLVIDAISWRILLEDFQAIYTQLVMLHSHELKFEPRLPSKTSSYQAWALRLEDLAKSAILDNELTYWSNVLSKPVQSLEIELSLDESDHEQPTSDALTGSIISIQRSLDPASTQALRRSATVFSSDLQTLLLTALILAYGDWRDPTVEAEVNLLINIESHGRHVLWEDLDVSRTVGWFTSFYPLVLTRVMDDDPGDTIAKVKNQLQQVPQSGIGYGILRYLCPKHADQFLSMNQPQILFNYLGMIERSLIRLENDAFQAAENRIVSDLFAPAAESSGIPFNPADERPYLLEINCAFVNEKFVIDWTFDQFKLAPGKVDLLADQYLKALGILIATTESNGSSVESADGYSTTDFPLAGVDQADLEKVVSRIKKTKKNF